MTGEYTQTRRYSAEDVERSIRESIRFARRRFQELSKTMRIGGRHMRIQHSDPVLRTELISLLTNAGAIVEVVTEQQLKPLNVSDEAWAEICRQDEETRRQRLGEFSDLMLLSAEDRRKLVRS